MAKEPWVINININTKHEDDNIYLEHKSNPIKEVKLNISLEPKKKLEKKNMELNNNIEIDTIQNSIFAKERANKISQHKLKKQEKQLYESNLKIDNYIDTTINKNPNDEDIPIGIILK